MSEPRTDPDRATGRTIDRGDAGLIERLRRDDREAMAALYDRYGRYAFGLAYRIVGEAADAEDVVQEAFLALWRQADRIDPARGSVASLLLTIVRRRSVDVIRRRSTQASPTPDEVLTDVPSGELDPLELASMSEQRELVRGALSGLPAEQRQAVELTYFGGLTVAEMAARQEVPVGTAKSRLRLAFDRLRTTLVHAR